MQRLERFGSVIGLKPEFEERYIILHKHTFPGVLKRIRDSNIRNYSIFLRDSMLFSYYEYRGQDYEKDMQKISEDTITQEWWKLTDPMQEPIQDRKEGEWWASLEEIGHFSSAESYGLHTQRFAYTAEKKPKRLPKMDIPEDVFDTLPIQNLFVFQQRRHLYLYCKCAETSASSHIGRVEKVMDRFFSRISFKNKKFQWESMVEVFHTD